ncbi:unnamed protein product [Durusdinium trenchii]|uniref:Uncharacterized protein n=2 Tax=Durusdinium trenchii TaxID=1381693 RepID=A0ABP0Q2D7_9DINO
MIRGMATSIWGISLLWIYVCACSGEGSACPPTPPPVITTQVLIQTGINSSAVSQMPAKPANGTAEADQSDQTAKELPWSSLQIWLVMKAVMLLLLLLCAVACLGSLRQPDIFNLRVKDTMTYNALGLLSWIALLSASRTVWINKTIWIMACRFCSVVLAVALLEISMFPDPGSMDPLAFSEITSVLTVFVSLLLGFYLTSSVKRWSTCIDGFLNLFEVIRALQMQLHALGVGRGDIARVVRYGLVSSWLCARLQRIDNIASKKKKAVYSPFQGLRDAPDVFLSLTDEECEKLEGIDDPCPILWLWVALFLGRLASDGDIPPMASPTYGRMVMLANDAQVALKEIRMTTEVKIPYLYTHTLSAIVHLNNILCAISMGLTLGSCIGAALTSIDSRLTLYGIESYPTSTASQTLQLLLVQSLKCFFVPLLYQACLEICFCLYSAFGGETEEAMIPSDRMVKEWSNELAGLMDLAMHPPHWQAPAFKHSISHVPDIQRTKAQISQSAKKPMKV